VCQLMEEGSVGAGICSPENCARIYRHSFRENKPKTGSINSGTGEKWPGPTIENPHYWDSDQEGRRRAITSPLPQDTQAKWHVGSLLIDSYFFRGRILGRNWGKSLKSFPS
jgi:hypothetical protein